jgi:hypothetical protein
MVKNMTYDIVAYERKLDEKLNCDVIIELTSLLNDELFIPFIVEGNGTEVIGFIANSIKRKSVISEDYIKRCIEDIVSSPKRKNNDPTYYIDHCLKMYLKR